MPDNFTMSIIAWKPPPVLVMCTATMFLYMKVSLGIVQSIFKERERKAMKSKRKYI